MAIEPASSHPVTSAACITTISHTPLSSDSAPWNFSYPRSQSLGIWHWPASLKGSASDAQVSPAIPQKSLRYPPVFTGQLTRLHNTVRALCWTGMGVTLGVVAISLRQVSTPPSLLSHVRHQKLQPPIVRSGLKWQIGSLIGQNMCIKAALLPNLRMIEVLGLSPTLGWQSYLTPANTSPDLPTPLYPRPQHLACTTGDHKWEALRWSGEINVQSAGSHGRGVEVPIGEEKLHLLQLMSPFDQPKPPSSQTRLQFALHSFW